MRFQRKTLTRDSKNCGGVQEEETITFAINKQNLSGGLTVSDDEVKQTIVELAENLKIVVEPGGAVAAAALLNNKIDVKDQTIVVMISGGNIDSEFFYNISKDCK